MAHQRNGADAQRDRNRQRTGFVIVALFACWVFGTPPTYVGIRPEAQVFAGETVFRDSEIVARPGLAQAKLCKPGAFSCVSGVGASALIASNP